MIFKREADWGFKHMFCKLSLLVFLTLILVPPSFASDDIGEVVEAKGKVQIKTIKAERLDGVSGVGISVGDLVKVRKKSFAVISMKDESKFQIGAKTTVVFDDFLYDSENQKLRARIIDGALAYDGQKKLPNSTREITANGFTLTVRGTKFAGKFGLSSQIVLLKGAVGVEGKGDEKLLSGPLKSVIFDNSGVGDPFTMPIEDIKAFFLDHGLNFESLVGPDYEQNLSKGGASCVGSNCGNAQ